MNSVWSLSEVGLATNLPNEPRPPTRPDNFRQRQVAFFMDKAARQHNSLSNSIGDAAPAEGKPLCYNVTDRGNFYTRSRLRPVSHVVHVRKAGLPCSYCRRVLLP
jgi:hypothetical protein